MKKICHIIAEQVFPTVSLQKANKQLAKKINSNETQSNGAYMDDIDAITIDSFRQKYDETFEVKNRFEDKAKTNVIGITIAITIIMGASGLTGSLINKYPSVILHWISFIILLVAIIYLLVSGIDAIKVLFNENTMSTVDLSDMSTDNPDVKKKYDDCTNRNIYRNIIRNNTLFSSYICIRNALICMIALFILISIPFTASKTSDYNADSEQSDSFISYRSTIVFPDDISVAEINDSIILDKMGRELIEDGAVYSFKSIADNYYVQYRCVGSEIIVEELESYNNMK